VKTPDYETRQFYLTMGKAIREARLRKDFSQLDLARRLGMTQGSVQFWESGLRRPQAHMILILSRVLGVTPGYLLGTESR
jgi:transcriptional regulator with XRE-family HTH domain